MSSLLDVTQIDKEWEPQAAKPLDEQRWHAWLAKGRERDQRGRAARVWAVEWVTIAVLVTAAALWSHVSPYDSAVRFIVTAGAVVMMIQAVQTRRYVFAAAFGALALLFNPVAPVLSFAGDWQRGVTLASAVPFAASLAWTNARRP